MSSSSARLVQQVRGGDPDAIARFVESHRGQLLGVIHRKMSPALRACVEAEDLLQEVMLAVMKGGGELFCKSEGEPFGVLCHLAEQRVVDAHRRYLGAQKRSAARQRSLDEPGAGGSSAALVDLLVLSMTSPSQAFSRNRKESWLQSALVDLPEEHREILRLRYVEGLPSKEIAARTGKTDGAVRVLLTRLLRRLQSMADPPPPSV